MRRAHGTGCIYQAKNGSWWASIYVGRKRVRRQRWSREDAELALAQILEEYADQLGVIYWRRKNGYMGRTVRHPVSAPSHYPRKGVTLQVRFAVLERDGFRCAYCGATSETAKLVVDHVLPIAAGGTDAIDNLTTACIACNHGNAARRLRVLPGRLAG